MSMTSTQSVTVKKTNDEAEYYAALMRENGKVIAGSCIHIEEILKLNMDKVFQRDVDKFQPLIPKIKEALEQDGSVHLQPVLVVYEIWDKIRPQDETSARRCLPMGRGKKSTGIYFAFRGNDPLNVATRSIEVAQIKGRVDNTDERINITASRPFVLGNGKVPALEEY